MELRSCECGAEGKRSVLSGLGRDLHRVSCAGPLCKASTAWYGDEAEAIAAWNRRAAPEAASGAGGLVALISEVVNAVDMQRRDDGFGLINYKVLDGEHHDYRTLTLGQLRAALRPDGQTGGK
jgi:hypothetical protein